MVVHTRVYINEKNFRALPVHPDPEIRISGILLRDPLVGWVVQKNLSIKSCCPYMILVSIIFFGGIGYLEGAQEALDLPPAVVPTGIDLARSD